VEPVPDPTALVLEQFAHEQAHLVDGDGEADAGVGAPLPRLHEAVDADEAAARVEQRPAGVARVDLGVGLHGVDVEVARFRRRATFARNDAERDDRCAIERVAVRVAHRKNKRARFELGGVTVCPAHVREPLLAAQLEQRDVALDLALAGIGVQGGGIALAIVQGDGEIAGAGNDVHVGQEETARIDDRSAAHGARLHNHFAGLRIEAGAVVHDRADRRGDIVD
jgi:hypothetical protein